MKQSKIPVPSKYLAVSLIPKPVKREKNDFEKENNPQIKVLSKSQVSGLKSKQPMVKIPPSKSTSEIKVEKRKEKEPSNCEGKKVLSSCPQVKLIKEQKPLQKIQEPSQKPMKNSTKNTSAKATERGPLNLRKNTLSSCPPIKLSKKTEPILKKEVISEKSVKNSGKPASTVDAKRVPSCKNILEFDDKHRKEYHPKTVPQVKITEKSIVKSPSKLEKLKCAEETLGSDDKNEEYSPAEPEEFKSNIDDNDAEFQASAFYKKLILNERELSPGIIKLCANKNFPSILANMSSPAKILQMKNMSADDLVEEVKRNSVLFHRWKGTLQSSPCLANVNMPEKILQMKNMSVENLVEDAKRNSVLFHRWKGKLHHSPYLAINSNSPLKRMSSINKENLLNPEHPMKARRESEFKINVLETPRSDFMNPNYRRWTTPRNFNINNIEAQRLSQIRRTSRFPTFKKLESLNPHEKVLQELNALALKKKEKSKKKVTFDLPDKSPASTAISKSTASSDLTPGLTIIPENGSENSTPELNSNLCKVLTNDSKPERCVQNDKSPSHITTPELHLNPSKTNETLFSVENEHSNKENCKSEITTPEFDLKTPFCSNVQNLLNPLICEKKDCENSSSLDEQFSKLHISSNHCDISSEDMCSAFEGVPYKTSSYSMDMPTTCLVKSMERIATSPHKQNSPLKEVKPEKLIFTPHPVSLCSKSKPSDNVSPMFLTGYAAEISPYVPIYTPYSMRSLAKNEYLSPVRQRLQFRNEPEAFNDARRMSQIFIQNMFTSQKTYDYLCDQECSIFSSQSSMVEDSRYLKNPVASVLSDGDQMHFVPLRPS